MKEKCIICDKELTSKGVFLCESDTLKLYYKLNTKLDIINNPTFKEHCMICGEWENRVIINFPTWNYTCNVCLRRAMNIYSPRNH